MSKFQSSVNGLLVIGVFLSMVVPSSVLAQEVRYSWLDISFMSQDVGRMGTQQPDLVQTVVVDASDGNGIRFRGSLGTWHNLYLFLDFGSTDIDVAGVVFSPLEPEGVLAEDEFDYTSIRGGIGLRIPLGLKADLYGEVTYDSLDFDFGSLAGEDFDMDAQDVGGAIGIRKMFGDNLQTSLYGRYAPVGDADLNTKEFDADTLVGVSFAYTLVRGLSIVGDYEAGEFSNWSVGFRLDLDED